MQQNRRGGGWVGWLVFIVIVFGSRFLPPVAAWLSQVTGLPISTPILVGALVGVGVVSSIVSSIMREVGRGRRSGETRLPTGQIPTVPPPVSAPPPSSRPPQQSNTGAPGPLSLPSSEQRLPGPPRFEPIIDPRILAWGLVGAALFGGAFLLVLFLS